MKHFFPPSSGRASALCDWRYWACAIGLIAFSGCGNGMSNVEGTITMDGAPLAGGREVRAMVCFYPEAQSGAAGIGRLDENGRYTLMTGTQKGIKPGPYTVSIAATEIIRPKDPQGMPGGRPITPARYSDPKQSGFRADVKPGSNTFDFALDSGSKR